MASIDASTSGAGGIITTADNTGTLNLQSGGTTIATINSTGLSMASGKVLAPTGPAFSAYRASDQTITAATFTKVQLNTETFDTANAFDNSTNYRFTPQVAGYYQINGTLTAGASSNLGRAILTFFKNGSIYSRGIDFPFSASSSYVYASYSDLIYFNGSTDYVELYVYLNGTGTLTVVAPSAGEYTRMSGFLARAA